MPNPKGTSSALLTKDGVMKGTNALGEEFIINHRNVTVGRTKSATIDLPVGMSVSEGWHWLGVIQQEEEKIVEVTEELKGFVPDCAYALQLAVEEMFGVKDMRSTPGFFGSKPPQSLNVPIDHEGNTVTVYIGRFSVPEYPHDTEYDREKNWIQTYPGNDMETLIVKTSTKNRLIPLFNKLIESARNMLRTQSIYRGKAFSITTEEIKDENGNKLNVNHPQFIDVDRTPAELALNAETQELIQTGVWTILERTEQVKHYNRGNARAGALFYGKPGTGKTLTALRTAKIAQDNGWTFILIKDSRMLPMLHKLALRYAPVVIFAEDVDMLVRFAGQDSINIFNNILDGVDSKKHDIITILTTNHIELLPPVMLRPGRFDTVVPFDAPNADTAVRLVRSYLPDQIDESNFDGAVIGNMLQGNVPAVIHEVTKRSSRTAILRYPKDYTGTLMITTSDLQSATNGMQHHMDLLRGQSKEQPSPVEVFGAAVGQGIGQAVVYASAAANAANAAATQPMSVVRLPSLKDAKAALKSNGAALGVDGAALEKAVNDLTGGGLTQE